ncbi:MAG: hypothetical protein WCE73_16785 [Candidatus Angelobacter sp.]
MDIIKQHTSLSECAVHKIRQSDLALIKLFFLHSNKLSCVRLPRFFYKSLPFGFLSRSIISIDDRYRFASWCTITRHEFAHHYVLALFPILQYVSGLSMRNVKATQLSAVDILANATSTDRYLFNHPSKPEPHSRRYLFAPNIPQALLDL